jgi:hypothetical protein
MIGSLARVFSRFRGSGDAAVTIPSLDGAFRPNQVLESAAVVVSIDEPDNLARSGDQVYFSSGRTLYRLAMGADGGVAERIADLEQSITCLGAHSDGAMAVGLASGGVVLRGGRFNGTRLDSVGGRPITCATSLAFVEANEIVICLGSQQNDPTQWKRDLLDSNSSGSVWRVHLESGTQKCLADRLAWPAGVVVTPEGRIVITEAWRHRILDVTAEPLKEILSDLPGYPARLAIAESGGYWLAISAPRSQLVELVLREDSYRQRMMIEIDPEFWVAPSLHAANDYREPLQAGSIKQLGELKPWSPSRSYGLIARLDAEFNPIESFHSRANGIRHGITSCVEIASRLLATSRGGGAVLEVRPQPNGKSTR